MIPNYVLVLGAPKSGKFTVSKHIAGVDDFLGENICHSGHIVKAKIDNKYFQLEISLLIDEFPEDGRDNPCSWEEKLDGFEKWYHEFCSEEFEELREVIEGIVFCFDMNQDPIEYVEGILDILDDMRDAMGDMWEGFMVVVGSNKAQPDLIEQFDDNVGLHAMEFIDFNQVGTNQYQEKIGKHRLTEIFHSHKWKNLDLKPQNYERNKLDKLNEMTEGLLSEHSNGNQSSPDGDTGEVHSCGVQNGKQHSEDACGTKLENEQQYNEGAWGTGLEDEQQYNEDADVLKQNANFDLSTIFEKLKLAKGNMEGMNEQQKQTYATNVIKEIIDFI